MSPSVQIRQWNTIRKKAMLVDSLMLLHSFALALPYKGEMAWKRQASVKLYHETEPILTDE